MMDPKDKAYIDCLLALLNSAIRTERGADDGTRGSIASLVAYLEDAIPKVIVTMEKVAILKETHDEIR